MLQYVRISVKHHLLELYTKIVELKTPYKIFVDSPILKLLVVI